MGMLCMFGNVDTRVEACHTCMQFVQGTLHCTFGVAQIVCAYGVPPLFDIAGSIQHTEVLFSVFSLFTNAGAHHNLVA